MQNLFKIATWNVNSLRVRLPHVMQWLAAEKPDLLALQETKLEDKDFPVSEFKQMGYNTVFSGQKTYNGVAFLSKLPLQNIVLDMPDLIDHQRRFLATTIDNWRIINLYVPNGAAVDSPSYQYKLMWLAKFRSYLQQQLILYPQLIVLGDFNIAPDDRDVHDPKAWQGQVLASAPERAALHAILQSGLIDAFRLFHENAGYYSWWDYRAAAWRRNLGLRIDHILVSMPLAKLCTACVIDKLPRGWERPSDHAPVLAVFHKTKIDSG